MSDEGVIYFAYDARSNITKIGHTTRTAESRLKELAHPFDLELLGTLVGTAEHERYLHKQYKDRRERGEWFTGRIEPSEGRTLLGQRLAQQVRIATRNAERIHEAAEMSERIAALALWLHEEGFSPRQWMDDPEQITPERFDKGSGVLVDSPDLTTIMERGCYEWLIAVLDKIDKPIPPWAAARGRAPQRTQPVMEAQIFLLARGWRQSGQWWIPPTERKIRARCISTQQAVALEEDWTGEEALVA